MPQPRQWRDSTLLNQSVTQQLSMRLSRHASEELNTRYSLAEMETLHLPEGEPPKPYDRP